MKYTRDIVVGEAYLRLLCIAGLAPELIEDHPQYSLTRDTTEGDLPTFSVKSLSSKRRKPSSKSSSSFSTSILSMNQSSMKKAK